MVRWKSYGLSSVNLKLMTPAFKSLVLVILACGAASSQNRNAAVIRQIDRYVRSVDRIVENKRQRKFVISDIAEQEDKEAKWKLFASEKALEKHRGISETYTIAFNWKHRGRTVASNFTDFSSSGDWTHYVYHYFRPDDTAAYVKAELRTFYGDYIVIHEQYFDVKGKQVRKRSKYLDLTTQKPKKPTDEMLDENSGFFKAEIYKSVAKLPFARLLGNK